MADNNGVVITPINIEYIGGSGSTIISGGSGPVTGATNFAVSNILDVQGYLTNSLGTAVTLSGNLNLPAPNSTVSVGSGSTGAYVIGSGGSGLKLAMNSSHAGIFTDTGGAIITDSYGFKATGPGTNFQATNTGLQLGLIGASNYGFGWPTTASLALYTNGSASIRVDSTGTLYAGQGQSTPTFIIGSGTQIATFTVPGTSLLAINANTTVNGALNNLSGPSSQFAAYRLGGTSNYGLGMTDATHAVFLANGTGSITLDSLGNAYFSGNIVSPAITVNAGNLFTTFASSILLTQGHAVSNTNAVGVWGLGWSDNTHTTLYTLGTASLNIDSVGNTWITGALNVTGAITTPTQMNINVSTGATALSTNGQANFGEIVLTRAVDALRFNANVNQRMSNTSILGWVSGSNTSALGMDTFLFRASSGTVGIASGSTIANTGTLGALQLSYLQLTASQAPVGGLYVSSATGDLWFSGTTGNWKLTPPASGSGSGGGTVISGSSSVFTGSILLSQSATPASASGYGQVFYSSSAQTLANTLYFEDARGSINTAAGYDPVYPKIFEEEFLFSNNNGSTMSSNGLFWPYFSLQGSGTGAAVTPAQTATAGHPGVISMSPGTTATGYIEMYMNPQGIRAGAGEIDVTWIVQVPTLSNGTDTFTVLAGIGNTVTAGSQTQGIFFNYTHGTNSGKWLCNTIGTTADSGVTVVAGTWYTLRILLDSTASNGYFFINGALVATITTNLPNGTFGPNIYISKSLGTTARTFLVDYFGMKLSGFNRA